MKSETIKEVVEVSKDVVSRVGNETVNLIMSKLEALAAGMGTTVEYLWGITVKQAVVEGWANILWLVLSTGVMVIYIFSIKMFMKSSWYNERKEYRGTRNDDPRSITAWLITVLMGIVVLAITIRLVVTGFSDIITCFANPEYWAFEQILTKIK